MHKGNWRLPGLMLVGLGMLCSGCSSDTRISSSAAEPAAMPSLPLSQAAGATAGVRAELFGRLGEAVRFYAAEADRRGIAGRACEAAYDRVRGGD
ncbi:DUF2514 family protein [Metapseudomonas furukawaii]|uniref:DUF2514 family protein n=1 Tax=Metapseudomonas furukawaii TaxID=1149133 RepID=UPI004045A9E2